MTLTLCDYPCSSRSVSCHPLLLDTLILLIDQLSACRCIPWVLPASKSLELSQKAPFILGDTFTYILETSGPSGHSLSYSVTLSFILHRLHH